MHVLKVKYLPPTNTRGSRVKVSSKRFNQFFIFSFKHEMNSCEEMAISELEKQGFHIIGMAEGYVMSDTFKPFDEKKWDAELKKRYPFLNVNK